MFRRKRTQRIAAEAQVVCEAIAIVEGRRPSETGGAGRGGSWISWLAHSRWEDLQRATLAGPLLPNRWDAAASYVAGNLLDKAKDADGLLTLQRSCLIPLELEMLAGRLQIPNRPADLVRTVDLDHKYHR
jgi:hypothetical protein